MYIKAIRVTGYTVLTEDQGGYVQYCLLVQGESPFMHQMAYIDLETCLPQKPPYFRASARFSELSEQHKQLVALHPRLILPQFPPKKWLGNKSSAFLAERMSQLNEYYYQLLETGELCSSPLWDQVFTPRKNIRVAIVGCPGIGKVRLVEGFLNCTAETRLELLSSQTTSTRSSEIGQVCPIDLIIRQAIVRLKSLTILQYNEASDLSMMRLLNSYDAVVLVCTEIKPETYEAIAELKTRVSQESIVACLDEGQSRHDQGVHVRTTGDAYLVFHHLLESM